MQKEDPFQYLANKWDITFSGDQNESSQKESLLAHITKKVAHWLDCDYEKLAHALYLLDIPEQQLQTVLETAPFDQMAGQIAELILAREMEKAKMRSNL
ncbi:hypothetical protein COY07_02250 [Candidatus Peregrinibacteria bacterium CG_4_10_14_0_2_um_filter_43_11]|nr:MAG: hypothetical protein COY07_02250 [Candidatus Peregrinibacteria bacterium CG_4_10_14_0_2_um_filter_43_11]